MQTLTFYIWLSNNRNIQKKHNKQLKSGEIFTFCMNFIDKSIETTKIKQ